MFYCQHVVFNFHFLRTTSGFGFHEQATHHAFYFLFHFLFFYNNIYKRSDKKTQYGSWPFKKYLVCDGMRSQCSVEQSPNTIGERYDYC